jgi:hypothetical protein
VLDRFFAVLTITLLVSRPFLARKVSNRSSHHVLQNGPGSGQFDSAFGLVNGPVKPWSNLVNLGRTWSKLSKLWEMYPGPRFEGFWARWTLVGLGTARSNLGQTSVNPGQTWSTLVKLGQTLGNVSRTFFLGVFDVTRLRRTMLAGSGLPVLRADTRENPVGKNGVMTGKNGPTLSQILLSVVDKTAYLGGNVCAKILSDPL